MKKNKGSKEFFISCLVDILTALVILGIVGGLFFVVKSLKTTDKETYQYVENVDNKVDNVDERVTALESQVELIKTDLSALQGKVNVFIDEYNQITVEVDDNLSESDIAFLTNYVDTKLDSRSEEIAETLWNEFKYQSGDLSWEYKNCTLVYRDSCWKVFPPRDFEVRTSYVIDFDTLWGKPCCFILNENVDYTFTDNCKNVIIDINHFPYGEDYNNVGSITIDDNVESITVHGSIGQLNFEFHGINFNYNGTVDINYIYDF